MRTMNQEIFERFQKTVEQFQNQKKIADQMKKKWTTRRKWINILSELRLILEKEFQNENVIFDIRTTTCCAHAWYTKLINDEARVYTSSRRVGRYANCSYLAMMVQPEEKKIPSQGGYAYYEYKKTQRKWVTRLVVRCINEEFQYNWRNDYYSESEEKRRIQKAITMLFAQKIASTKLP